MTVSTAASTAPSASAKEPILVVDDCSIDSTRTTALAAGADVISVPYHLGLGGCVQAGYRLAFDLGFQYVIRLDGDGLGLCEERIIQFQRGLHVWVSIWFYG